MSDSLHPSAGVRILLEREPAPEGGGEGARYRGAIFTPDARFDFAVAIGSAAAVEVTRVDRPDAAGAPPERAVELLRALARTLGRHALAESPPGWPRRVLRWRRLT